MTLAFYDKECQQVETVVNRKKTFMFLFFSLLSVSFVFYADYFPDRSEERKRKRRKKKSVERKRKRRKKKSVEREKR